ncbi:hypothetical protein M6B38_289080 [Iris pallida]|uniref:Uncharacterized protein n=1 Tax=Iris pallida TaxID=29817 RepID=A0AAX6EJW6_IRIPA|nr:hypothetical protein M6B38_187110 [Iris pallida]KAJ6845183.1 hypothetical protein M6B38_289080 [Iris pallida]
MTTTSTTSSGHGRGGRPLGEDKGHRRLRRSCSQRCWIFR